MLSGGNPSGARLDRVWNRIEERVVPKRSRSLLRIFLGAMVPVAAVIALLFFNLPGELRERGVGAPLLEATCGSSDAPCRVGEPVHLRLMPGRGVAYVYLLERDQRRLLAGPIALADEAVPVPVKITPEDRDIAERIRIQAMIGETPHTLVLHVVP